MKRYRTVLTLTAAGAAMSLLLWRDRERATTDELRARRRNVWQGLHRERVTRITVTRGGESFSLHKDGPQWLVQTANGRRPGDPLEVERLLSDGSTHPTEPYLRGKADPASGSTSLNAGSLLLTAGSAH